MATATETKIKNAIMECLMAVIDRENYGMMSTKSASIEASNVLRQNGIKVDYRNGIVYKDESPLYKIRRKYAKRKANGFYKQLKPTLEAIG